MTLTLLSTWSKRHEVQTPFDLPRGWRLATHQWEVYEALHDPNVDVVFDTAMTGDGKTLAAILPAIYQKDTLDKTLLAYPTNELIRDQYRQFEAWGKRLGFWARRQAVDSQSLTEYAESLKIHRHEALEDVAYCNDLVLTNPDIFILIQRAHYDRQKYANARIAQTWLNQYRLIVLDEFHIFGTPQATTVLDAIAFNRASLGNRFAAKFLFLSATPDGVLVRKLEEAGLNVRTIQGQYLHGEIKRDSYRRILHRVDLQLIDGSDGIENWVMNNIQRIQDIYANDSKTRGLILANSLAKAKRITYFLRKNFKGTIGENTSLTSKAERELSRSCDLIVATSTVDVGVDFDINLIIFESVNAGTFIQRLGRLGRHDGFETYQAYALLPDWIIGKIADHFTDNEQINREDFFQAIREKVYRQPQEFFGYVRRWGGVSAGLHHAKLNRFHYQTLGERYSQLAKDFIGSFSYPNHLQEFKEHRSILEDLSAFRGTSRLDVWVYDVTAKAIKSMSVIRLLGTTEFTLIEVKEAEDISKHHEVAFYPSKVGLYAKIDEYRASHRQLEYLFVGRLNAQSLNIARERRGLRIRTQHAEIKRINQHLEQMSLTTCAADPEKYDMGKLKRQFNLPFFFDIQEVCDDNGRGTQYAVAFGLDALLLDSMLHFRPTNGFWIT